MQEINLSVDPLDSGTRLDVYLFKQLSEKKIGISRTSLQKLISQGWVKLSGRAVKANHRVKAGESISISIIKSKPIDLEPEPIELEVIFEDNDLAVINKPCGIVVHPAPGNYRHTLVNALLYRFKDLSSINPSRPGIVHRLDKQTSGLLVIAKNDNAHLQLTKQFSQHSIKRRYLALVKGSMEFDENIIELPLARHPRNWKKISVAMGAGKYAKTHYRTLRRSPLASLVELTPHTGRTHQLRVHLAFIGHSILGDSNYGKEETFSRLALHAHYIGFSHPTTYQFIEFSIPMPQEFSIWIDKNMRA